MAETRRVLAAHPALVHLVNPADSKADFAIRIANGGGQGTPAGLVAGLISRAGELGEQGLKLAATELTTLIDPPDGRPANLVFDDPLIGFHVVLLHGLRIADEIPVADNSAMVPFQTLDAFVNRRVAGQIFVLLRVVSERSMARDGCSS